MAGCVRGATPAGGGPIRFSRPFNITNSFLRFSPGQRWGLFRVSDKITVSTTHSKWIHVFTIRGETVYDGPPGPLPKLEPNHYFVETDGDRSQFAVLPDDYAGASFLGTNADPARDSLLNQVQPAWARVMGEGYWSVVQPRRDTWDWETLDRTVAANPKRKMIVVAAVRPNWVRDDEFFQSYARYIAEMARRYEGKIYAIEVWNEPYHEGPESARLPDATSWNNLLRQYTLLLKVSREAVNSVHSSVRVFGPAFSYPFNNLKPLVDVGAAKLLDAFTWHDYRNNLYAPDQDYPNLLRVDKIGAEYRSLFPSIPLLADEVGLFANSALGIKDTGSDPLFRTNADWHRGMCRAVKLCVMYRAASVEAIIPHVLELYNEVPRNPNWSIYGWDASANGALYPRGPHCKTSAFLMSCYRLDGAEPLGRRVLGDRMFFYAWRKAGKPPFVIAWCTESDSAPLTPPRGMRVEDVYGRRIQSRTLGEEPLFFQFEADRSGASALDAVTAALRK